MSNAIADLNDAFRQRGAGHGRVFLTHGACRLAWKAGGTTADIVRAVRSFSDFSKENDPLGEHDFGAFDWEGQKVFWKIDYCSREDEDAGAEDPANADTTLRVLTVMLAEEY